MMWHQTMSEYDFGFTWLNAVLLNHIRAVWDVHLVTCWVCVQSASTSQHDDTTALILTGKSTVMLIDGWHCCTVLQLSLVSADAPRSVYLCLFTKTLCHVVSVAAYMNCVQSTPSPVICLVATHLYVPPVFLDIVCALRVSAMFILKRSALVSLQYWDKLFGKWKVFSLL